MSARNLKMSVLLVVAAILGGLLATGALAAEGVVSQEGVVTSYTQPSQANGASAIDYPNAEPMPLPAVNLPPVEFPSAGSEVQYEGESGSEPGRRGDGEMNIMKLPLGKTAGEEEGIGAGDDIIPQEFGTSNHPFTTSRVDLASNTPSRLYPYRAAGKLYFQDGASTFVCSASLIKRGVVVTAAHCVAAFGQSRFYSNWQFVPAQFGNTAPYGVWGTSIAWVMTSYFNGTDSCAQAGVICQNDVAVLLLTPQSGVYAGTSTGWLGYGWNGYGFTPTSLALINQLGYPVSHDSGLKMQRSDSQGFVATSLSNNTVWGSRQTGGSSGGPEVVNLGKRAVLSGTSLGSEGGSNRVVGVTSWGYINPAVKQQGASPFTSGNIVPLVNAACTAAAEACRP